MKVLSNPSVAAATRTRKDPSNLLHSKEEILLNTIWRMLSIRGYISPDHTLTPWGKALFAALQALPPIPADKPGMLLELEEAVIVTIELARLGVLSAEDMFPMYAGAPYSTDATVNRNTLLVARIACSARFSHKEIGYTGPLSRHLLGYHSMVVAVRESLRDLAEACLVNLLFNGDATRARTDWADLGYEYVFVKPQER